MKRQTAWRVFAGEFNDSTVEIKGEGEMAPSFVVTPLGAKINRVFIVGVLTDVETISEGGELVRAHISDPTGVYTLYSGSYQQEVTDQLQNINAPAFVAVTGKARTYTPEEGTMFVSIRPENIMEVKADVRDHWILETCQRTRDRIEAYIEAAKLVEKNVFSLKKLGYNTDISEGIISSIENYENVDLQRYITLIKESIEYLNPGKETSLEKEPEKTTKQKTKTDTKNTETEKDEPDDTKDFEEIENTVLENIKKIEGDDGAPWDSITEKCEKAGLDKDSIEEALSSLMDKGLIYEPILGTIKTT